MHHWPKKPGTYILEHRNGERLAFTLKTSGDWLNGYSTPDMIANGYLGVRLPVEQAFEVWAKRIGLDLSKLLNGIYKSDETWAAWKGFAAGYGGTHAETSTGPETHQQPSEEV